MLPLTREDVCFDVGCGKGRTVCHFARMRVRKVVGIEVSARLAACAAANARSLRGRVAPIEIRNTDAALADYDEGTLFFMFNPFGAKTMTSVLSRIEAAHRPAKRQVRIVYVNPILREALGGLPWLRRERSVTLVNGLGVEIYRTSFE
ncbi:MAG: class I SAM-dependent methyltransferase [Candidatus Methylomirabilales bacterium]